MNKQLVEKIEAILKNGLDYYTTENIDSTKGLMETMLSISIDNTPARQKEDDLIHLMVEVQNKCQYTLIELSRHFWMTVGLYYLELEKIKNNDYKNIHLLGEK